MSIFDTEPPNINKHLLYKWLNDNYDSLNYKFTESFKLNSERDYNLKVITENNKKYIVKISNPLEEYDILLLQDSMLNYLSKSIIKNLIPKPVHKEIKKYKDLNGRECFVRILPFIEGDIFANNQNNKILCQNLAKFLGLLSKSLVNFEHNAAHREFIWNSINIEWIKNDIGLFSDKSKIDVINMVIDSYNNNIKPMLKNFRYSIIHGDANNYNVVSLDNKIVGLLDYGDSIYAPTVCELTVALAYSLMNSSNIIDKCCYMVESFQSEFPLNKIEIEAISSLIASRLLISVTMAAKQKKKYPNNNYLSISEKDSWNLLFKLNDINLQELTYNLLKRSNYEK